MEHSIELVARVGFGRFCRTIKGVKLPGLKAYKRNWLIHGESYSLEFRRTIDHERKTLGTCDPCDKKIVIRLGQSKRDVLTTFIHEVLHAFEYEYGFPMEHKLVYELENAIADFLINNF